MAAGAAPAAGHRRWPQPRTGLPLTLTQNGRIPDEKETITDFSSQRMRAREGTHTHMCTTFFMEAGGRAVVVVVVVVVVVLVVVAASAAVVVIVEARVVW